MAIFAQVQGASSANSGVSSGLPWPSRSDVSVTAENGAFKVRTPYSSRFVDDLKLNIPSTGRKWDAASKSWIVARQYGDKLKEIIDLAYSCSVIMPTVIAPVIEKFTLTFQADYVANCKNEASSVHCNGGWNAKIPEAVLRSWFKQVDNTAPATLYGVLGVEKSATDVEIKKAYKRAARQWHPDVCREDNAREMFERVKDAYQVLIDSLSRLKYNAGLMFEEMSRGGNGNHRHYKNRYSSFIPTLRCGMLTVKATQDLGIVIVDEILAWEDIENEHGQIMVSFWSGDSFQALWV